MLARVQANMKARKTYNQITLVDHTKSGPKGIDPKAVWLYRISQSDMARHTLIEPILPKDAKCASKAALQVFSLSVLVLKDRWTWPVDHTVLGMRLFDAWL